MFAVYALVLTGVVCMLCKYLYVPILGGEGPEEEAVGGMEGKSREELKLLRVPRIRSFIKLRGVSVFDTLL